MQVVIVLFVAFGALFALAAHEREQERRRQYEWAMRKVRTIAEAFSLRMALSVSKLGMSAQEASAALIRLGEAIRKAGGVTITSEYRTGKGDA